MAKTKSNTNGNSSTTTSSNYNKTKKSSTEPELPLIIKDAGLTVKSFGRKYVDPEGRADVEANYWKIVKGERLYPFTIGYSATREYCGLHYEMSIAKGADGPIFRVKEVETGNLYEGTFASQPCTQIMNRRKLPKINGAEFYGFEHEIVQKYLNAAPPLEEADNNNNNNNTSMDMSNNNTRNIVDEEDYEGDSEVGNKVSKTSKAKKSSTNSRSSNNTTNALPPPTAMEIEGTTDSLLLNNITFEELKRLLILSKARLQAEHDLIQERLESIRELATTSEAQTERDIQRRDDGSKEETSPRPATNTKTKPTLVQQETNDNDDTEEEEEEQQQQQQQQQQEHRETPSKKARIAEPEPTPKDDEDDDNNNDNDEVASSGSIEFNGAESDDLGASDDERPPVRPHPQITQTETVIPASVALTLMHDDFGYVGPIDETQAIEEELEGKQTSHQNNADLDQELLNAVSKKREKAAVSNDQGSEDLASSEGSKPKEQATPSPRHIEIGSTEEEQRTVPETLGEKVNQMSKNREKLLASDAFEDIRPSSVQKKQAEEDEDMTDDDSTQIADISMSVVELSPPKKAQQEIVVLESTHESNNNNNNNSINNNSINNKARSSSMGPSVSSIQPAQQSNRSDASNKLPSFKMSSPTEFDDDENIENGDSDVSTNKNTANGTASRDEHIRVDNYEKQKRSTPTSASSSAAAGKQSNSVSSSDSNGGPGLINPDSLLAELEDEEPDTRKSIAATVPSTPATSTAQKAGNKFSIPATPPIMGTLTPQSSSPPRRHVVPTTPDSPDLFSPSRTPAARRPSAANNKLAQKARAISYVELSDSDEEEDDAPSKATPPADQARGEDNGVNNINKKDRNYNNNNNNAEEEDDDRYNEETAPTAPMDDRVPDDSQDRRSRGGTLTDTMRSSFAASSDFVMMSQHSLPLHPIRQINRHHQLVLQSKIRQGAAVISISFCPCAPKMAICTKTEVAVWDLISKDWIKTEAYTADESNNEEFYSAQFTPDGDALVIAASLVQESVVDMDDTPATMRDDDDEQAVLKEAVSCVRIYTMEPTITQLPPQQRKIQPRVNKEYHFSMNNVHAGRINDMLVTSVESIIITAGEDGKIKKFEMESDWSAEESRVELLQMTDRPAIKSISLVPNKASILIGVSEDKLGIWNYESCSLIQEASIPDLIFSKVLVLDAENPKFPRGIFALVIYHSNKDHTQKCAMLSIPDLHLNPQLALVYQRKEIPSASLSQSVEEALCMAVTGTYLTVGTQRGKVNIFNYVTGQCVGILINQDGKRVEANQFHPELPLLATGAHDGVVCVYCQTE